MSGLEAPPERWVHEGISQTAARYLVAQVYKPAVSPTSSWQTVRILENRSSGVQCATRMPGKLRRSDIIEFLRMPQCITSASTSCREKVEC